MAPSGLVTAFTGKVDVGGAKTTRPHSGCWSPRNWRCGRASGYGELVAGLQRLAVLSAEPLTRPPAWRVASPLDAVTGGRRFVSDLDLQGMLHALAATANTFARGSCIDGLAHAARAESLQFRLDHLADPRVAALVRAAAARFGWGIASCKKTGGSQPCAEVQPGPARTLSVIRIVTAYECGAVVNQIQTPSPARSRAGP